MTYNKYSSCITFQPKQTLITHGSYFWLCNAIYRDGVQLCHS